MQTLILTLIISVAFLLKFINPLLLCSCFAKLRPTGKFQGPVVTSFLKIITAVPYIFEIVIFVLLFEPELIVF